VVLVFGELYNENTRKALEDLDRVCASTRLRGTKVSVYLIVAQNLPVAELRAKQKKQKIKAVVLHDPTRMAFAAYGVIVLPSVVVLDGKGRICSAISGYPLAFTDMVSDALLYAAGKLTRRQFELAGKAPAAETSQDEKRFRSERLAGLASQLLRRGYTELAVERFQESLKEDPDLISARVGLARCFIKLSRLDRAAAALAPVLRTDPKNVTANLVFAYIEIERGGSELARASERLRRILLVSPHNAEAYYLTGLIHEAKGETEKAAASFKKAAELLLEK
jgi:Tfp pilus assembly protein PilF